MIPFQLPTGKTVFIPLEKYLDLTDEEIQDMIADDLGYFIDDPFHLPLEDDKEVFEVPDVYSEDLTLTDEERRQIEKDLEDD